MTDMPVSHRRERGVSIVMLTFLVAFVLIPMIGLTIDGAILFWMKAKLSAAVDAAALAAARSLNVGLDFPSQQDNAKKVGQQYFAANFPTGLMGAAVVNGQANIDVALDKVNPHVIRATVAASITVPTYFMRILQFDSSTVSANGQASRRDANIILVLDRSGSMTSGGSCGSLIASAQDFVDKFVDGRDRLGLVTFQSSAKMDYDPTLTFKSSTPNLNSVLGTLNCGGNTNSAAGLSVAYDWIKTKIVPNSGYLNAIVFFTDGQPNVVQADYRRKELLDIRYNSTLTSAPFPYPPSSCTAASFQGLINDASSETAKDIYTLNQTGQTGGVFDVPNVPITQGGNLNVNPPPGCVFGSSRRMREDVEAIPDTDAFGNSTRGNQWIPLEDGLDLFPTGHPYAGKIRPDTPRTVHRAAFSAAESIALKIRNDTNYGTIIYSIGLQGNESMAMDQGFMERVANDPRAQNHDPNPDKGQGLFVLATNKSALASAFNNIASQILRLSQ